MPYPTPNQRTADPGNRVLIYIRHMHFCLEKQKSRISKIHIFAYAQIYNTLCSTQFRTEHQDHTFQTARCRKAAFLIQDKGIPSPDISARILLRYTFRLNYECTIRERNATIAIDLKTEINAT